MLKVGLTGGIGSGKSTAARIFADLGARVIDGDEIARSLVAPGEPALAAIVAAFGPDVLRPDGQLDRSALADVVFRDEGELARLDAIMHPLIAEDARRQLEAAEADGAAVTVYDMPLLVETAGPDEFDLVIVVAAPLSARLARLAARGIAADEARRRMARQATDAHRAAVADIVLDNSGDHEHLRAQVQRTWEQLGPAA